MNIKKTFCTLTLMSLVLFPAAAVADRHLTEVSGVELLGKMGVGRSVTRFELDFPCKSDAEDVRARALELAERLGWEIGSRRLTKLGDNRIALRNEEDPSASFEMDTRSGSFLFNGGLARYRKDGETPGLPAEGQAKEIALDSLAKLELLPDKAEFANINEGGLSMAVRDPDGKTTVYRKLVRLRIDRQIDGLRVMGDSRIVVHLGTEGRLAGLVYQWPKVRGGNELAPNELRDATDLRESAESRLLEGSAGADRADITKVDLVLYDDGHGVIEPAYHVEARLYYSGEDRRVGEKYAYDVPFDFYVPVPKAPLAIYPSMELAPVPPTDARRRKGEPSQDE